MEAAQIGRGVIDRMPGTGVVVVDDDLHVVLLKGELYADFDQTAANGRHVSEVMSAEAWDVLRPRYEAAVMGRAQSFEFGLRDLVWSVRMSPIGALDAAEPAAGVMVLIQDVAPRAKVEVQLRAAEALQRSIVEVLSEGIIAIDGGGQVVQANRAAKAILCLDLEPGRAGHQWWTALDARHPDGVPLDMRSPGQEMLRTGVEVREVPITVLRGDGVRRTLLLNYGLLGDRGSPDGIVMSFRDVTEQAAAHTALVETQTRLRDAHDLASLSTWEWDVADDTVTILQSLPGHEPDSRMSIGALLAPVPAADVARITRCVDALRDGSADHELVQYRYELQVGQTVHVETRMRALRAADGRLTAVLGTTQDVSERVRNETQLRSAHDYLRTVANSMTQGLCALDPDGCTTYVNPAAEGILGRTAAELTGTVFADTVRLAPRPDRVEVVEGATVASTWPGGRAHAADDVFTRGDGVRIPVAYNVSPFEAPDGSRGTVLLFSDNTDEIEQRRRVAGSLEDLAWVTRINHAIEHDRFVLYAQPIIALATGEVVQHELLIRMLADDGSVIAPGAFLPAAERYGLIREIDRWVVRRAAQLSAAGHTVEINISADSLGDARFAAAVERELRQGDADCAKIVVELTETAVLRDEAAAAGLIGRMRSLGCGVALDDFGTGYGGFTYLKRLSVDFLKIDVEFVRDLAKTPASQHVVRAVVNLAHDFGHRTVAEGVEDAETLELLRDMGVDLAQGYHIGRPAPVTETFGDLTATATAHGGAPRGPR